MLDAIHAIFTKDLSGQVLNFDGEATDIYAEIGRWPSAAGKPISQIDAMIAAIARSRGASLATRNVKDFEGGDIQVLDPWNM